MALSSRDRIGLHQLWGWEETSGNAHLSNYQIWRFDIDWFLSSHTGFTKGFEENQKEIVIQFKPRDI